MNKPPLFLLLGAALAAGCPDPQTASQQRNAAHATPASLARGERTPPTRAARTFRVRVHATAAYTGQTVDWSKAARDMLDGADQVLVPALGARLEAGELRADWAPPSEADMKTALDALRAFDAGDDADWVVGMIGGLPTVTESFHLLGIAETLGNHIVVRGPFLNEHDAIAKAFDRLSEDDRAKLEKDRKRHRAVAVFLHEIGHTLGAIHETTRGSLMFPSYGTEMSGFGDDALGLMKVALAHRDEKDPKPRARDLLARIEGSPAAPWVPADREALASELRAELAPPAPKASPEPAQPSPEEQVVAAISAEDRAVFAQALDAAQRGDAMTAWKTAQPLYAKYPDLFVLQDFRCRMAMQIGGAMSFVREECKAVTDLTMHPKTP